MALLVQQLGDPSMQRHQLGGQGSRCGEPFGQKNALANAPRIGPDHGAAEEERSQVLRQF
eukprot:scaffold902_cov242-Pinguiococcus_pyrenoidosus.AAC.3